MSKQSRLAKAGICFVDFTPMEKPPVPLVPKGPSTYLMGAKIGHILVLGKVMKSPGDTKGEEWLCRCDCGGLVTRNTNWLLSDKTQKVCDRKCPHWKDKPPKEEGFFGKIALGQRYGRILITGTAGRNGRGKSGIVVYKGICLCGNECFMLQHHPYMRRDPKCCKKCDMKLDTKEQREYVQTFIKSRVKKTRAGCWVWKTIAGKETQYRCNVLQREKLPHRVSYMAFKGPVPYGTEIVQECGHSRCVILS